MWVIYVDWDNIVKHFKLIHYQLLQAIEKMLAMA